MTQLKTKPATPVPSPDLAMAAAFLAAITGAPDGWSVPVAFRTFTQDEAKKAALPLGDEGRAHDTLAATHKGTLRQHAAKLARVNAAGGGVCVAINAGPEGAPVTKAAEVALVRAFWVDDDSGTADWRSLPAAPSVVVRTRKGRHFYWAIEPGFPAAGFTDAQRRLIASIPGADPAVCDPPRVMALPGFYNVKDLAAPAAVTVEEQPGAARYVAVDVLAGFPEVKRPARPTAPPPLPKNWDASPRRQDAYRGKMLAQLADEMRETAPGGRNHALFRLAARAGNYAAACGLGEAEAAGALLDAAEAAGLPRAEAAAAFGSGWRKGVAEPRALIEREPPPLSAPAGREADRRGTEPPAPEAPAPEAQTGFDPLNNTTAAALMGKTFPAIRWAVPDLLPEGLGILAGPPKLGKSWLALGFGLAIGCGGYALGKYSVPPGDVLYLALEDGERRLQARMRQALAGGELAPSRLHFRTTWPGMHEGGLAHLSAWGDAHPDARLVVIDTLGKFRGPTPRNLNAYEADYAVLGLLQRWAIDRGIAVLVVTHLKKGLAADSVEAVTGSTGITGAADTIMVLKRSRGSADGELILTGREVREAELALRFDDTCGAWSVLGDAAQHRHTSERADVLEVMRDAGAPMKPSEVAGLVGSKREAVKKIMQRMKKAGELVPADGGRYALPDWCPPNGDRGAKGVPNGVPASMPLEFDLSGTSGTGDTPHETLGEGPEEIVDWGAAS